MRFMLDRLRTAADRTAGKRICAVRSKSPKEEEKVEGTPEGKNPAAVALGRLGGQRGGKARAKKLTPERRSEIARKAAQARWKKYDR